MARVESSRRPFQQDLQRKKKENQFILLKIKKTFEEQILDH